MTKRIIKEPATIQAILQAGMTTDFWRIICDSIDERIERLAKERDSDSIASLQANDYKLAMENIKDNITFLQELKNLPKKIIQNIENPNSGEEEEMDPYPRTE